MFTDHTQRSIMRSDIANIDKIFKSQDLDVQNQTAGFIPKVWTNKGITGATNTTTYIYPPNYVTNNTIIGVSFGVSLGAYERTYFSLGDTGALAQYDMFVHYNKKFKRIKMEIKTGASSVASKDYTLAVFYEDRKS